MQRVDRGGQQGEDGDCRLSARHRHVGSVTRSSSLTTLDVYVKKLTRLSITLLSPPSAVVLMAATCMPSWHRQFIARIVTDPRGWGEGGFHFIPLSGDSTLNATDEEVRDGAQGRGEDSVTEVCGDTWRVHVGGRQG